MSLNKCFYTLDETYPFLTDFADNIKHVKKDLQNTIEIPWQEWKEYNLYQDDTSWTVFPIIVFGKWVKKNIKLCPNLYHLLKTIPNLVNASFSKLGPNSCLNPHRGWAQLSNFVLRCHLGVQVPDECYVYCWQDEDYDEDRPPEKRKQAEGNWIVFDDSKWHFADNKSTHDRYVLILDLARPGHIEKGISQVEDTPEVIEFLNSLQDDS